MVFLDGSWGGGVVMGVVDVASEMCVRGKTVTTVGRKQSTDRNNDGGAMTTSRVVGGRDGLQA